MACVLVDENELKKIKQGKYINSGDEGSCYLYNNLIFKLYHNSIYDRRVYFDLENSNNIAFPEDILIDINNKTILGYTMKNLSGINIKNGFLDDLNLENLKNAYKKIKNEIEKYSYIDMNNISLTNTLFDYRNNNINLIDTSLWTSGVELDNLNKERLNYMLIKALCITLDWDRYKLNSQKILFDLYGMHLNGNSYFIDFLTEIERSIMELNQCKIKTIKDLRL